MENTKYPNAKFAIIPTILASTGIGIFSWIDEKNLVFTTITILVMGIITFVSAGTYSAISKVEKSSR